MTQDEARTVRAQFLAAFDIYKSNVQYGIEIETEAEHAEMMAWYLSMLDLPSDKSIYRNTSKKIKRYLPRIGVESHFAD